MKLNNNDDSHNSGLNLLIYNMLLDIESHPAWVCGLKQRAVLLAAQAQGVTPCVGVWIETLTEITNFCIIVVTPCVGVWIETYGYSHSYNPIESHPAWVCGLKLSIPYTGPMYQQSHPAWVCGLKQNLIDINYIRPSHTLRGCVD